MDPISSPVQPTTPIEGFPAISAKAQGKQMVNGHGPIPDSNGTVALPSPTFSFKARPDPHDMSAALSNIEAEDERETVESEEWKGNYLLRSKRRAEVIIGKESESRKVSFLQHRFNHY
jgi:hypothetical protein